MSKLNNITEIISLGSTMISNAATLQRGTKLLTDLADELLPEQVTITGNTTAAVKPVKKTPPAPVVEAPTAAAVPVPPAPVAEKPVVPPAPVPTAPAAPVATMTPEELNSALVVEFKRLGSRDAIDNAMAELGVTSVNDLSPDQYQPLLAKVQGIQ